MSKRELYEKGDAVSVEVGVVTGICLKVFALPFFV